MMPRLLVLLLLALSALGAYAQDFSEADNSQASAVDAFDEFEVDTDASGASAAFTEVSVPMQHSFDGKKWEEAATLTAQKQREGISGVRVSRLRVRRNAGNAQSSKAFQALVDNDAMYRVRVPSGVLGEVKEGASADDYVVAFVKARCLAHAGMSEHVTLHMDSVGRVGALAYRTPSGQCAPDLAPLKQDAWSFARATANVQYARVAPGLKGMHVAPDRPDSETSTTLGPDGQPVAKKPKTFFQRNWMFIMPAMFIIMNIINPPPQQQQGGGQRKAAAGGAAKKSS